MLKNSSAIKHHAKELSMSSIKSPQIMRHQGLMKITDSYSIDNEANRQFQKTPMSFINSSSIEDLIRRSQKKIAIQRTNRGSVNSRSSFLLKQFPGHVYGMIGDYLCEKLPLIIFTNRTSFTVCLTYQIESYQNYLAQARSQKQQFEEIMYQIPGKKLEILQEINEIAEIIRVYDQITANLVSFLRIIK